MWGAIAAMLVAVPSSIAFGVVIFTAASPSLASAGALAGVLGAAALGMTAPLIGRNGALITAPCAPAAAVMSGLAAQLAGQGNLSSARILMLLALTAFVAALLQVIYGLARAGQLIKYIPYQVVNGYLSGVAVIIAFAQFPRFVGSKARSLPDALVTPHTWQWPSIVVGTVTILAMVLATRLTKKVPGAIIGLASGIGAYFAVAQFEPRLLHLANNPLIVGPIHVEGSFLGGMSLRLAALSSLRMSDLLVVIGPALTLSALLSIDTLKTGVVLDAVTRSRHNSNRELIGQGVANVASFFAGGVPGSGTMGPTLINVTSGGRSIWSGVGEGVLVLVALLALSGVIAWVPIAALAGILLVIAWRMFSFEMFKLLLSPATRLDFLVIAAVVVVAESVGLIEASLTGVCLAIVLFIRNQMRGSVILRRGDLHAIRSKRRRSPDAMTILDAHGTEAVVVQLKDDLFFGTTDQLFTQLERDLNSCHYLLFDFRRVQSMDYTAAHLFLQMDTRLRERGGRLLFSGLPSRLPSHQDIEHYMGQLGLVGSDDGIPVFETRDAALEWIEERILSAAGWVAGESTVPMTLKQIEFLRGLDAEAIDYLQRVGRDVTMPEGSRVFSAGDGGDEIFFVRRGRIHILLPLEGGKRHHLATFGRGEFFGEMAFLDRGVRSADADAATETELFALSRSIFDEAAKTHQEVAAAVFAHLALATARRLRVADEELRALEER